MYLSHAFQTAPVRQRRQCPRYGLQCRAHIQIGKRHYAGYVDNISLNGAKLTTINSIGKPGAVILTLPDLPPISCELRWTDRRNAGVVFDRALTTIELRRWVDGRLAVEELNRGPEAEYTKLQTATGAAV